MSCTNVPTLSILVTISAILNQVWQRRTEANCAHLEKQAAAAASVSQTSNTVSSLVICSTSLNLLPKWQRSNDAPWVFVLQCAATRMPSPALSIYVIWSMFRTIFFIASAIRLFNFSRRVLLSSPSTFPAPPRTRDPPRVPLSSTPRLFRSYRRKTLSDATRSTTRRSVPFGISECSFENDKHDAQTVVRPAHLLRAASLPGSVVRCIQVPCEQNPM